MGMDGLVGALEYMVLVNEVLDMVGHYIQGIAVDAESLAVDLIHRVGPEGNYLQEAHTLKHFREVWYPRLFDRSVNAC
jgi:trimethylamine--corrinoid protein Co-methyltransferase